MEHHSSTTVPSFSPCISKLYTTLPKMYINCATIMHNQPIIPGLDDCMFKFQISPIHRYCADGMLSCKTGSRYQVYSGTSHNGPSHERTTTGCGTEITTELVFNQPPTSGRFLIPDSGQAECSQLTNRCLYS